MALEYVFIIKVYVFVFSPTAVKFYRKFLKKYIKYETWF